MKGRESFALFGAVLLAAAAAASPARAGLRLVPMQTLYGGTGLAEVSAVVSSPDGRHVYAAGRADNALVAFARDATTGLLTRVQILRDDVGGVDGLRRVWSLAISPDGAHVYVATEGEDTLAVFARDAATGVLQFADIVRDETSESLDRFTGSIAVSPDGDHVYVAGFDAVNVFLRDSASGRLTFVEEQRGSDRVAGLQGADAIAVSPDGKHVYVGGFNEDSLVIFARDPQRGTLTPAGLLHDGIDGADGLDQPRAISLSPDGRSLYVAGHDDDSIAVFDRDPDSGRLAFAQILRDGAGPVRGLDGAFSVAVSSDGRRVYAAGLNSSSLVVFERDTASGRLEFVDAFVDGEQAIDGLAGALRLTISPDAVNVYVAGLFDDAIAIFADGLAPRFLAAERGTQGSIDGLGDAQAAALSRDEKYLYVAEAFDGGIGIFARDAATGRVEFVESYGAQPSGIRITLPALAVTADGAQLLVSEFLAGVSVLQRDPVTGGLSPLQRLHQSVPGTDQETADAANNVSAIAVSPDGEQVFFASFFNDTLAVFDRDPASGELAFRAALDVKIDGTGAMAVSADGTYVYTTGAGDDLVVAFRRDPTSAGLELVQAAHNDEGVVEPIALALSPDDSTLYVVSPFAFGAANVFVFERNSADGRLSLVQALTDGVGGVDGVAGANAVAVLPDGSAVIVAGPGDGLAVFSRDLGSGRLTFVRALRDGEGGADGLAGVTSLVVSRDSRYLYVTAAADSALTAFRLIDDGEVPCPGDCAADGSVSIGELIRCVGVALGRGELAECFQCDADASGAVGIDDLIRAVATSLNGCP